MEKLRNIREYLKMADIKGWSDESKLEREKIINGLLLMMVFNQPKVLKPKSEIISIPYCGCMLNPSMVISEYLNNCKLKERQRRGEKIKLSERTKKLLMQHKKPIMFHGFKTNVFGFENVNVPFDEVINGETFQGLKKIHTLPEAMMIASLLIEKDIIIKPSYFHAVVFFRMPNNEEVYFLRIGAGCNNNYVEIDSDLVENVGNYHNLVFNEYYKVCFSEIK